MRLAVLAVLAGLAAAVAVWLTLASTTGLVQTLATGALLVGLGLGGWTALVWAAQRDDSEQPDGGGGGAGAADRPERLTRLERLASEAADSAAVEHQRLRPLLRAVAADRLEALHGVRMDEEPARAAALLGGQAWELLRPDRPPPADRTAPGRGVGGLAAIVTAIEGGEPCST